MDFQYNSVKSYVFLKVRQLFDPPQTSYLITAVEKQIEELEWRLNTHREETEWVDPDPHRQCISKTSMKEAVVEVEVADEEVVR